MTPLCEQGRGDVVVGGAVDLLGGARGLSLSLLYFSCATMEESITSLFREVSTSMGLHGATQ